MSRYLLSPAAQADIDNIFEFTCEQWGFEQAEKYVRELQYAIERAVANPGIGRACDEIRPGYRALPAGSHTLYYRITGDVIDVVRILHQRMDIDHNL